MKVLKFGGSSVANSHRIKGIGSLIVERWQKSEMLTIIFSAFGGVTDQLILAAEQASQGNLIYEQTLSELEIRHSESVISLLSDTNYLSETQEEVFKNFNILRDLLKGVFLVREASLRTMDYILSFGERNSAFIISQYFSSLGLPAQYVDAREIIRTNKDFGNAKVNLPLTEKLISEYYALHSKSLNIVTGFIATDKGGLTTTLGRGGSDYTAALIAGALTSEVLEIWTDVDGVLTSNPKVVANAHTIPQLSYDEAMEMSHFGAKVIYPPTIQPALSKSIPIFIKNTFNPTFTGTKISKEGSPDQNKKITGVSSISNVNILTLEGSGLMGIPGSAARLFTCLGQHKINIVMITQASSEHSICMAVMATDAILAAEIVNEEFKKEIESQLVKRLHIEKDVALVAVIGEKMKSVPGLAGSLFKSLGQNGVNIIAIAQGSSELNITFAIKQKDEKKALNLVHDTFFLSENKGLNVFLVGVGLIGSTLISQIREQHERLIKEKRLNIQIIGISNSSKMYFDDDGIDLKQWKSLLAGHGELSSFESFINKMTQYNFANSIFIDCTANTEIKTHYPRILSNAISISTANKTAASGAYADYQMLHDLALKKNVRFMFETNVGAGLPVISTLEGLVRSGDKIESIQAVISGSLSYIFNNYSSDKNFKDLILEAGEKGYTEPDPRDDLSGQDIKRKIIILCRVAGYPIEPEEVSVEALLPQSCMEAESIDDFFVELEKHDAFFRSLINEAHDKKAKLRYVASLEDGKASIDLKMVTLESPFYNLASTDNMIVFHTARYKERPLVIQGPGAGADVTAAGIFAEIIQLGTALD